MTDPAAKPIVVSENAGTIDSLVTLGRQLVYLFGAIPVLLTVLGSGNVEEIIAFLQSADMVKILAAIGTIVAAVFGFLKSRKRGSQIATVAADSRVPDRVATIKP